MDKSNLLKDYKNQNDKIVLAQVLDKIEKCKKTSKISFTDFLDMYQISIVNTFLKKNKINNYKLFGGYEEAERKVLIVYPDNYTEGMIIKNYLKIFNIVRVKLDDDSRGKYNHRNYLGGIVKLGLKREKVGDIIVDEEGADIITVSSFSEILKNELGSLTRFNNSIIEIKEINELKKVEIQVEQIKIIVPSLRLDNFVSDLARTSRNKALEIIKQERVFINGKNEIKPSKQVKINDIITIRGKGRFIVKSCEGTTRSGRSVLLIEKYK